MGIKTSHSQLSLYATCGKKYKLRYIDKLKTKYISSALLFGSALDNALNTLLLSRDLDKSIEDFEKNWAYQTFNGKYISLFDNVAIQYYASDLDINLFDDDDFNKLKCDKDVDLSRVTDKTWLANANWLSMRRKGLAMLRSYHSEVLPLIREVKAVQHKFELVNGVGDIIVGYVDLIVEWHDGRIILFDNKTTSRPYDSEQAARSQQLLTYFYQLEEQFKLNNVGFITLSKSINLNKIRNCKKCGFVSDSRHKTCNETVDNVRCNGEWDVKTNPKCDINVIINDVTEEAKDLVLEAVDTANEGIKRGYFPPNLSACKQGPITCEYFKVCWANDKKDIDTGNDD